MDLLRPVVEVDKDVRRPKQLLQFLARDDFARTFEEQTQDLNRLLREPDPDAASA
jgi:hypothetical protein